MRGSAGASDVERETASLVLPYRTSGSFAFACKGVGFFENM